jgi:hypothetical protein
LTVGYKAEVSDEEVPVRDFNAISTCPSDGRVIFVCSLVVHRSDAHRCVRYVLPHGLSVVEVVCLPERSTGHCPSACASGAGWFVGSQAAGPCL